MAAPWTVGYRPGEFTVADAEALQQQIEAHFLGDGPMPLTPGQVADEIGGGEQTRFGRHWPVTDVTWPGGEGPVLYAEMLAATVDVLPMGNESGGVASAISIYGEGSLQAFREEFHGAGPWKHDASGREVDHAFYRDAQGYRYALKTPSGALVPATLQDVLDYLGRGRQP